MRRANGGRYVPPGSTKRADDQVGAANLERREQLAELGGVVLAVAVEPDGDAVPPSRA